MNLKERINQYSDNFQNCLKQSIENNMECMKFLVQSIKEAKNNGRIFFIGNGASSSISSHAALDFNKVLGLATQALTSSDVLSMLVNDFGEHREYASWLKLNKLNSNDVVILISSSGESDNVIQAWNEACNLMKGPHKIFTFTGFEQNNWLNSKDFGNKNHLWVNSNVYNVVENIHSMILMMICDLLTKGDKNGL